MMSTLLSSLATWHVRVWAPERQPPTTETSGQKGEHEERENETRTERCTIVLHHHSQIQYRRRRAFI